MVPPKINNIAAFNCLYDKYASPLYGVILKLTPNVDVANSILEKSFIKIWGELESYDASKSRLFSFMLRITLQECKTEVGISKNRLYQLFIEKEHLTLLPEQYKGSFHILNHNDAKFTQ